jgi:hypothetical protein
MNGFNGNFRLMMKDMRQEARRQALEVSELKWQVMTLPVLRQVDNSFASISRELIKNHCPDETFDSFNDSWEALKRLIRNIQQEKNDGEKKD